MARDISGRRDRGGGPPRSADRILRHWLYDLAHGTSSRFTFNSKDNDYPVWSPDGSHIAFTSGRDGGRSLYQRATSGAAQDEALDKAARDKRSDSWSRDSRYIFEQITDPKTGYDIWVLLLVGDRKAFPYLRSDFNERFARLSPNGQWLAHTSDETKRYEIYVQTFSRSRWSSPFSPRVAAWTGRTGIAISFTFFEIVALFLPLPATTMSKSGSLDAEVTGRKCGSKPS